MTNRITFTIIAASLFLAACSQDDTMPRETLPGEKASGALLRRRNGDDPHRGRGSTTTGRSPSPGPKPTKWASTAATTAALGRQLCLHRHPYKSDATRCSFSASDSYELFTWTKTAAQSYYAYYPYAKITDRTPNPEAHPSRSRPCKPSRRGTPRPISPATG